MASKHLAYQHQITQQWPERLLWRAETADTFLVYGTENGVAVEI